MAIQEVRGIVLYKKNHRERDFLVKILTAEFGPLMFFVRGSKRQTGAIYRAIEPMTMAIYIADIRDSGLSFIQGAKNIQPLTSLKSDIVKNAYASHLLSLTNAAIEDRIPNLELFVGLKQALLLMNKEDHARVVSLIFEVKCLKHFGAMPEFRGCVVCGRTSGKFDYSSQFHGLLCPDHFYLDPRRLHGSPRAVHLIRQFRAVKFDQINSIDLREETCQEIEYIIDQIYDDLVGIQLNTKKFIRQMLKWDQEIEEAHKKFASENDGK